MLTKVEGIILKETLYGETSKIINVLTKEYGLIGIMCKGAMGIKSKLRSSTLKLTYVSLSIYYKKDKLSILSESDIIDYFSNIKKDIIKISYSSYLCDLIYQVCKDNYNKKIYDDFLNSLIKINNNINPLVITNILEVKLLDYLGIGLNLTSCCMCGNKKDIVTLSSEKGGLICKYCYSDERLVPISLVKVINMYYLIDIKSINEIKLKDNVINEINIFLEAYYDDYSGLYLKSKNFLKTIKG